jgi:pyruvate dehydrogenase E1 component alpha subunit
MITSDLANQIYTALVRCRLFEDKVAELYPQKEMKCPTHLSTGQEAAASGVCAALRKDDRVFSTHRCHSHILAKGGDFKALMAELYGKAAGCSKGKGGSMHFLEPEIGMMGSSAIVGGTIPLAVGSALASVLQSKDNVSVAFFGDGGLEQGTFHECMSFASLKKLPILFISENNDMATCTHLNSRQPYPELYKHAESYAMPGVRTDGTRVETVYEAAVQAVERARKGQGPSFIEVVCYRWKEHDGPNTDYHLGHRTKEELEAWMAKDPVKLFGELADRQNLLSASEQEKIRAKVQEEIDLAVAFAKASPFPEPAAMFEDL